MSTPTHRPITVTEWSQAEIDEIKIEATVLVYLTWDDEAGRWVVDPVTVQSGPLDYHDEKVYTDCGKRRDLPQVKKEEWDRAYEADLPDATELYLQLGAVLNS